MTETQTPHTANDRTVIINALARQARKNLGWNQHQLSGETDRTVRTLAQLELDTGERGQFYRRLMKRSKKGQLAGLSVATISNIERGRPIFLESAVILAKTLNIQLPTLTAPHPPSRAAPPASGDEARASP